MSRAIEPVRVIFHLRKPVPGRHFSIETVFRAMREALPADFEQRTSVCPYESRGVIRRLANLVGARLSGDGVHHVTGDVHYLALALDGRRTILTIHDCGWVQRSRLADVLFKLLWFKLPVWKAGVVTTVSNFTRRELQGLVGCDGEKIRVVPSCVSPIFKKASRPFNCERPTILHVGTTGNKNLLRLAAALEGVQCRLRVAGQLSTAQRAALVANRINYSESVNLSDQDLVKAYEEADIVAFVSTYEGFGLPIVEANAVGRPVIAGDVTAMPEVAGDAAVLVNPYDVRAIRTAILRVIHNPELRAQLIKRGLQNWRRFAPGVVARMYAAIYRELAGP